MSTKLKHQLWLFTIHCLWTIMGQVIVGQRPKDLQDDYYELCDTLSQRIKML